MLSIYIYIIYEVKIYLNLCDNFYIFKQRLNYADKRKNFKRIKKKQ